MTPAGLPGAPGAGNGERAGGNLSLRPGPEFVAGWGAVYRKVYRWRREGRFSVVPSLFHAPVRSYLPGLACSDLGVAEARALALEIGKIGGRFHLRVLGRPEPEDSLPAGVPVVSRLDFSAFGHDLDLVWRRGLNQAARKYVRRARRRYEVSEESGPEGFAALMAMLGPAFARHGSPLPPAALFAALRSEMDGRVAVVRERRSGAVAAAALWFRDGPLVWTPWSGARRDPDRPGRLLFWNLVEQAVHEGAEVLDFGRSALGSGSYLFKRSFGAVPVPLRWFSHRPPDLYRRYGPAQRVWRRLPRGLTGRLGPRLCRYLADY